MKINFLVNQVFNGWEPTDTRLGGTEESVVRWAEELAKRGHEVQVFRNPSQWLAPTEYNLVAYAPRHMYKGGGDICINIKSSDIEPKEQTLYLTNETDADKLDLSAYLGVIWPSNWAVNNIPVNNRTFVLPHGYDETKIYPEFKIKKQCLYASSPDRGLDVLLKAWPEIHKYQPKATLLVTYGATIEKPLPNVYFLGNVDEDYMNELYRTSEYWLHPCTGGELFGITGIKAQAAGCWPIIVPTMALDETVKYGTRTTFKDYANDAIAAMEYHDPIPSIRFPNWSDSTDKLLEIIDSVL